MKRPRILVVDGETEILRSLRRHLIACGYDVATAQSGEEALRLLAAYRPDVTILEVAMPDMDGLEVIRHVRQFFTSAIIVLSVRSAERDKVAALDVGADDYVTKPFGIEEFLARIRAALRRIASPNATPIFETGNVHVDVDSRRVMVSGQEVHLTPLEFELLASLIRHAGKVVTHHLLLREVWGDPRSANPHYLHVYVRQLRQKLESDPNHPRFIVTEPGVGYRLCPDCLT